MLDSLGSLPTGVLRGSVLEYGSPELCFGAEMRNKTGARISSKFCHVYVYLPADVPVPPVAPRMVGPQTTNLKSHTEMQAISRVGKVRLYGALFYTWTYLVLSAQFLIWPYMAVSYVISLNESSISSKTTMRTAAYSFRHKKNLSEVSSARAHMVTEM